MAILTASLLFPDFQVLDEGRLVEFDEPYLLLKNPKGVFTQLVEQTGTRSVDVLRESARQAYELRHDEPPSTPDDGPIGTLSTNTTDMEVENPNQESNDNDGDDDDDGNDSDTPFIEQKSHRE